MEKSSYDVVLSMWTMRWAVCTNGTLPAEIVDWTVTNWLLCRSVQWTKSSSCRLR